MTKTFVGIAALAVMALGSSAAVAAPYRYDARAQALFVKNGSGPILGLGVVSTMPRFKDWESTDTAIKANLTGILSTGALRAHCETSNGHVRSTAKVDGLKILPSILPLVPDLISAGTITSVTTDTVNGDPHGSSTFENLKILGEPFTVTGEPNQKLSLSVAGLGKVQIAFNVQRTSADGTMNNVALRVTLPTGILIEVAKSVAGSTPKSGPQT